MCGLPSRYLHAPAPEYPPPARYGLCPVCRARGFLRSDYYGRDTCVAGHSYRSADALPPESPPCEASPSPPSSC